MFKLYGFSGPRKVAAYYDSVLPDLLASWQVAPPPSLWVAAPLPSDRPKHAYLARLAAVWKNHAALPDSESKLAETLGVETLPGEELLSRFIFYENIVGRFTLSPVYLHCVRRAMGPAPGVDVLACTSGLPSTLNVYQLICALCYLFGVEHVRRLLDEELHRSYDREPNFRANVADKKITRGDEEFSPQASEWLFGRLEAPACFVFPLSIEGEDVLDPFYEHLAQLRIYPTHVVDKGWDGVFKNWPLADAADAAAALGALAERADKAQFDAVVEILSGELHDRDASPAKLLRRLVHLLETDVMRFERMKLVQGDRYVSGVAASDDSDSLISAISQGGFAYGYEDDGYDLDGFEAARLRVEVTNRLNAER